MLSLILGLSSEASAGIFTRKKKAQAEANDKRSAYAKFLDGAERRAGLFEVLRKGGDYYFVIPDSLMGRDMLVVNRLQRVPLELNEAGVNRGVNYEHKMIRLEWSKGSDKLLVREQRAIPLVNASDAIARSVADNYISPLIASLKVEQVSEDGHNIVVKVNGLYDGSETSLNNTFDNINLGTSALKDLSRIQQIKSFANNVVAYSELTTRVREGNSTVNVTVEISSSILLLPKYPMQGRLASHRIGYFTTPMLSYSDSQLSTERKHFIQRWRLEPREEDKARYLQGELVEPRQPITFYIDPSTPRQWRKYIKQGVEAWQDAFASAGWVRAIRAVELSEDASQRIDVDDVNYSVINYVASEKKNAMGPALVDPRSGEILEADIMWWHNVMTTLREWIVVQTGLLDPKARQANMPEEVMGEAIRFVACHEVGHSLGLRHNMIASNAYTIAELRNPQFMDSVRSTAASVMDYARYNYVAQPGDGVKHLAPGIGAYDRLAIEYGYRWYGLAPETEAQQLSDLLARHKGRLYRYSEAQDSREAVDPRAQIEDLSDDAIGAGVLGVANLKRIVPEIIRWTTTGEREQSYERASELYYAVIYQWNNYLYHALSHIGGMYIDNTVVGDGQPTYTFVERQRQRQAVDFLLSEVLTYPRWLSDAEVSKYTYLLRRTPNGVVENAPSQIIGNTQAYILWDLLNNDRLVRMLEQEAQLGKRAFTAVELMEALHGRLFGMTERGAFPDVRERNLQKNFLDALLTSSAAREGVKLNKGLQLGDEDALGALPMLCKPQDGVKAKSLWGEPRKLNFYGSQLNRISDAISVKRGELLRIRRLLQARLPKISDKAVRYHYEDMLLRISNALELR